MATRAQPAAQASPSSHFVAPVWLMPTSTLLASVLIGSFIYVLKQLVDTQQSSTSVVCSAGPLFMCVYMFLSTNVVFSTHAAKDVKLSPVVPTTIIYALKLLVALLMYR